MWRCLRPSPWCLLAHLGDESLDCGEVGVSVAAYDWMAGVRWARTAVHVESRCEVYMIECEVEIAVAIHSRRRRMRRVSRYGRPECFLNESVPVAEEVGVELALHANDPPRESLRGIARIVNSPEAYDRVLDAYKSLHHGSERVNTQAGVH